MALRLRDWLARAPRVGCDWSAQLTLGELDRAVSLVNLSLTGAFVELHEPLANGERVVLVMPTPGSDDLNLPGRIVRTGTARKPLSKHGLDDLVVAVPGIGLEFEELDDPTAERLQDFIDFLLDQ